MRKFLSFVQARNALCSLFPTNKWAENYRDIESDKQAYWDRSRLVQMVFDAPLLPVDKKDMDRFLKDYSEWTSKTRDFLHKTGNGPYRFYSKEDLYKV